ncbi:MAG: hypothetical protein M0O96_11540 [Desulforhopalus sp.]|nr:hypothetical protein [Desulforhopalus sp.]
MTCQQDCNQFALAMELLIGEGYGAGDAGRACPVSAVTAIVTGKWPPFPKQWFFSERIIG